MVMFTWSLTTGMFTPLPFWATHAIWFWSCMWLLVDSFTLLNDLDDTKKQLQKAKDGLDLQTAEKIDCLERHLKTYIMCADMRHALTTQPRYRTTRSHSG